MIFKAIPIEKFDFSEYGTYYNMKTDRDKIYITMTGTYEDYMTKTSLIDTQGHLGYTIGKGVPYDMKLMEKHDHTQEALFCAAEPIIVCFAKSRGDRPPLSEDVRAVVLNPGEVIVLNRNIWHDACRGIGKGTPYYYLASQGTKPADWIEIEGDPVHIEV